MTVSADSPAYSKVPATMMKAIAAITKSAHKGLTFLVGHREICVHLRFGSAGARGTSPRRLRQNRGARAAVRGTIALSGNMIAYRRLTAADLARVAEIDRTERIDTLYVQHSASLQELVGGDWSAPAWSSDGEGQHSVAHQIAECERHLAAGAIALGAFADGQLVGIGLVTPHIRPGIAQLAFYTSATSIAAAASAGT